MAQKRQLKTWNETKSAQEAGANAPDLYQAYQKAAQAAIGETLNYAQNILHRDEVANTLTSGAVYRPENGTYSNINYDLLSNSILTNWDAVMQGRDRGLYDLKNYATNPMTSVLSSTAYLESILPMLRDEYDQSVIADQEAKNSKEQTAETEGRWLDLYKQKDAKNEADQWYNWLMADYLLGDRSELFDIEKLNSRYDAMSDDEYYAEEARLREQYDNLDWETLTGSKTNRYDSKTSALGDGISTVEKELKNRQAAEALETEARAAADFGQYSIYSGATLSEDAWIGGGKVEKADIELLATDYGFINSGATWQQATNASEKMASVAKYMSEGYNYLLPEEIEVYNYYYQKGELDKAAEYLEAKRNDLLYRRYQFNEAVTQSRANTYAVGTFFDAGVQGLANVFYTPYQIIETLTGRDNPYSAAFDALNAQNATTEEHLSMIQDADIAQWVKDVGSTAYLGVAGFRDNMARLAATGFNPTGSLIIAGLQSTSRSLQESSERDDMSEAAKIIKAIGTGAIEMGTEKIGLDELFKAGKRGALQQIRSVILSELGEESLNYISEPALEAVVAFLFEHEADIKSGPEFWEGLTDTWLQTAVSSLLMGGGSAYAQNRSDSSTGKDISKTGDLGGVVDFAFELSPDSVAHATASEIKAKTDSGKKVGFSQYGKLFRQIEEVMGAEVAETTNGVYDKAIENRLIELGTPEATAKKNAPIIRKLANDQKLTIQERSGFEWDDNVKQVVQELSKETKEGEEQRTGNSWKHKLAADLGVVRQESAERDLKLSRVRYTDKAAKSAAEKGKQMVSTDKKLKPEAVSFSDGDNSGEGKVTKFEQGKGNKIMAVIDKGDGTATTVPVESINATGNEGLGTIVSYIKNEGDTKHRDLDAQEASTMLNVYNTVGGNAQNFIQDFETSYLSGYAGIENIPATTNKQVAELAYNYGKESAKADEGNRAKMTGKAGTGATTWVGKVNSSEQIGKAAPTETLEQAMERMTETQQVTVRVASALAKKMGIDIAFYESDPNHMGEIENGSFIPGTNQIYIDVNSGVSTQEALTEAKKHNTLGYAILRTMAHELTHYMENNSNEGYAAYKQAVKDALKANGKDWAELVRWKIDVAIRHGQKLTIKGAEAEVIADASEYMLQDSKFIKELDTDTVSKIKTFIQDFMVRIRNAFKSLMGSHVESDALRDVYDGVKKYSQQLQDLWDAGMELAIERVQGEGKSETAAGDVQYAIRDGMITTESTEAERFNVLKDVFINVARVNQERLEDVNLEEYNTRKKSAVEKGIKALAAKLGITNVDLGNSYIDFQFQFTNKNLGKSLHHQLDYGGTYQDYVKAMSCFNELVENAVPVETHKDKKSETAKGNVDLKQVYVLLSVFSDGKAITPVQMVIKEFQGNNNKLYMTVAMTKITPEVVEAPGVRNAKVPAPLFSGDTISLRYLIENVNSNDYRFFKYIPDGFLNDEQKAAKKRALDEQAEEYASYGDKQTSLRDDEYMDAVNSGDMAKAQRMVDEAANRAGYTPLKLYHGTRNFGFKKFDVNRMDDKMSIFVTNNERIAESYSGENPNRSLKDSVAAGGRYDFLNRPARELESLVQEYVDKNLRVPTEKELRQFTDFESSTILSAVDRVNDYIHQIGDNADIETRQALQNIAYYGEKLAQIPYAELEDETDAYKLRMKYSDAVFDLSFADRDAYDKLAALINRPVVDSANNLITARFNDPFYNEKYATFTDKFNVTDKLGDKLFSGVYDLYADQSGLFVIDANDSNWNTIDGALIDRPGVRVLTRDVASYAKQNGYKGAQIKNVRDSGGMTAYSGASDVYIFFDNTALKSADPVTYDDNGNVIPLSERFISSNEDIRYSLRDDESSPDGIEIDTEDGSAYRQFPIRSWDASDYVQKRDEMIDRLVKTLGVSKNKAKKWINDVNSVSAIILGDKLRLDYTPTAVEGATAFKSNPEYGGSIDMSTICAKRRLATGTLDAIQERLGDAVLTKDDFLRIREVMKERGHEVACGLCFVESSRKNLAKYTAQFLAEFNASHPDNQVGMTDFNTVDGLERTRVSNKEAYAAYEKFMNKLAQRKPKLFEKRTEYQHEILKKFKKDTTVSIKNLNGGLRLQSFSDFEIVHLIDMMQVITDMASVGLAGQAYTKVPDFAWALGDTGLKINLSLIAKGVDADGNLIFDDVEGMNHVEARKLRERYSKNVGTIVVTFTDEQLIAAMKNDMVDYIIPFHRSQWQKSDYKLLGLPDNTKDYTMHQNEKEGGKRVKENFLPNAYWDFSLSGKENAEKYLAMCNAAGRTPKFAKFLHKNSDGTYSLQEDGSTDGYWKLLIDFKMYDNDGVGSPQLPVTPDFNMKQAKRMLNEYTGEHDTFPVAEDVVEDFVKEYTDRKGGIKSAGGKFTVQGAQFSLRDTPDDLSVREYLMDADESVAATIEEKNALTIYQQRLREHAEASEAVMAAEAALIGKTGEDLKQAKADLAAARARQKELYARLIKVENTEHVQKVFDRSVGFIREEIAGKTDEEIAQAIADREAKIATLTADLAGLKGAAKAQAEADIRYHERIVNQLRSSAARRIRAMSKRHAQVIENLRTRRDMNLEIAKKAKHIKGIIKRLNDRIVHEGDYKNVKEDLKPAVHNVVRAFIDGFGNLVFDSKQADKLRRVYDLLAKEGSESEYAFSDDVARWIDELAALAAQDEERRMSGGSSMESVAEKLETYEKVSDIAEHIYHLVKHADEMFVNGKKEQFSQYSAEVGNELIKRKDKDLYVGAAGKALKILDDLIRRGNMTPVYFFESLKNSGLMKLYDNLMAGQRKYAEAILAGKRAVAEAQHKYNYYTWSRKPQTFKTQQGHTIALTVEQKLWVYATAKREASNELMQTHHLDQGGFRYDANFLPKANAFKAMAGSNEFHKLNAKDVAAIADTLTAEQKAYADVLVEFLSDDMAALGNEASMELFGIRKYNEKYYFPFKTASDQRYQGSATGSASTTDDARVKHSSFTHALTKGANTALVMGNFTDVVANHINLMSTYSSFVVPIESLNRVLNRKVNTMEDGSGNDVTIRSLVGRKYGDAAQKYIADLLKDMNGGPQVDNRGGLSGLMRIFKRSAVVGSLSVAVQQPTAYIRAFAYVSPKYFTHLTGEGYKATWDKMMKYSGTAVIKDMGRFDVGMGKMADEWIANSGMEGYNVFQRGKFLLDEKGKKAMVDNYVDFATSLPGVLDQVTWTHLWKAIEAEQADLHPDMKRNSEEFLRAVGKRFDEVVNHTQVYDSILSKSQNMRSKNPLTQMSTSFMAEPTLNWNLFTSAFTGGHGKAQAAKMITATVLANVAAAALAAAISAWNKDDDERKGLEKYMATFSSRLFDSLNPATMIPFLSDLWNILSGYDVERLDWSVVKDLYDYTSSFFGKVSEGKEITWRDVENFAGSWANMAGIPAKNVSRDLRRFVNFLNTDHSLPTASSLKYSLNDELAPGWLWADSGKAYCQRFVAAIADGDTREAYDLWEYMNGTKGVSQSSLETNIRAALKEAVQNGTITTEKATEVLRKYVPYKNDKDNQNKPQEWLKETK